MLMLNSKRNGGSGSGSAPVPPQRHSSIRPNAPSTPPTHMANASHQFGSSSGLSLGSGQGAGASVGRLVNDLETKFGKRFHNVTEFPKPPPFLNIHKVYPSRTFKATNAPGNSTVNNNNSSVASNNNTTTTPNPGGSGGAAPMLKPAYAPLKKNRAPAPPPQAGVAAATVSVIRQSSFLYGGAAGGSGGSSSIRPQSQPAGIGPRNSTVY